MKYLVIENVTSLEIEISQYLDKIVDPVHEFHIFYCANDEDKQEELLERLKWCDAIIVQSTFYFREQLKNMVDVVGKLPNIKEIHIIYSYNKSDDRNIGLLRLFNQDIPQDVKNSIISLLTKIKVYDVCFFTTQHVKEPNSYFKTITVYFDAVELYYNERLNWIWHRRKPLFSSVFDDLYVDNWVLESSIKKPKVKKKSRGEKTIVIEKQDVNSFRSLMNETKSFVRSQLQSCQEHDFGDNDILIPEKENWLAIMDKYKL